MQHQLSLQFLDSEDVEFINKIVREPPTIRAIYDRTVEKLSVEQLGKQFLLTLRDLQAIFGEDKIQISVGRPKFGVPFETHINNCITAYGTMVSDLALPFIYAMSQKWDVKTNKTYVVFAGVFCPPCSYEVPYIINIAKKENAEVVIISGDEAEELAELMGVEAYPTVFVTRTNLENLNPLVADPLEINEDDFEQFVKQFSQMLNI